MNLCRADLSILKVIGGCYRDALHCLPSLANDASGNAIQTPHETH